MIFQIKTISLILLILAFEVTSKKYSDDKWQEFKEFQKWKRSKDRGRENENWEIKNHSVLKEHKQQKCHNETKKNVMQPPPIDDVALMARYVVNQADWTSIATISSRKDIESYPFVNLVALSDGPLGNGSGIPYMYLTPLDFTSQDLYKDNRATLMMSLAQGNYCDSKNWDPMDPRCARVYLTGKVKEVKNDSAEIEIAKTAIFNRHPGLVHVPENHHFYFAKLKMFSIVIFDTFGGAKYVKVKDYLHPPGEQVTEESLQRLKLAPVQYDTNTTRDSKNLVSNVSQPVVYST